MPTLAEFWEWAWAVGRPFLILCMVGILFYKGKIVLRSEYDRMVCEKDARIKEKDDKIKELWDMFKITVTASISVSDKALTRKQQNGA